MYKRPSTTRHHFVYAHLRTRSAMRFGLGRDGGAGIGVDHEVCESALQCCYVGGFGRSTVWSTRPRVEMCRSRTGSGRTSRAVCAEILQIAFFMQLAYQSILEECKDMVLTHLGRRVVSSSWSWRRSAFPFLGCEHVEMHAGVCVYCLFALQKVKAMRSRPRWD